MRFAYRHSFCDKEIFQLDQYFEMAEFKLKPFASAGRILHTSGLACQRQAGHLPCLPQSEKKHSQGKRTSAWVLRSLHAIFLGSASLHTAFGETLTQFFWLGDQCDSVFAVIYDGCPRSMSERVWWERALFNQQVSRSCPKGAQGRWTGRTLTPPHLSCQCLGVSGTKVDNWLQRLAGAAWTAYYLQLFQQGTLFG